MLADLRAQLHFVRRIQEVDTARVQPLKSLRDETRAADREQEVDLESMRDALEETEVSIGRWHRRIRRKGGKDMEADKDKERKSKQSWDVLGQAPQRVGRFFVVKSAET